MTTDGTGIPKLNAAILGVFAILVIYMIWIGISGTPIPEWVYWITTIL